MATSGEDPRSEAARQEAEHPDWLFGLGQKPGTVAASRYIPGTGWVTLHDTAYDRLRARVDVFNEVFGYTEDPQAAVKAANELKLDL